METEVNPYESPPAVPAEVPRPLDRNLARQALFGLAAGIAITLVPLLATIAEHGYTVQSIVIAAVVYGTVVSFVLLLIYFRLRAPRAR